MVVLFLFAVALMGDVAANTIAHPLFVLGLLGLSTAVTFGLSGLTLLIFARAGLHTALPLAHAAGSRNTGLMLAAAAGAVPELVWLYVALLADSDLRAAADHQAAAAPAIPSAAAHDDGHQTLMLVVGAASCACRLINCFSRLAKFGASGLAEAAAAVLAAAGVVISTLVPSA